MLQGESADTTKRLDPRVEALRERALEAGVSLRALARCVGVHHSTLSRVWRGQLAPSARLLAVLDACLAAGAWESPMPGVPDPGSGAHLGRAQFLASGEPAMPPILLPQGITPRRLLRELDRLSQVARSSEVHDMVRVGFRQKRRGLAAARFGGTMLARLDRLFALYEDAQWCESHPDAAVRVAGCLLYFILTEDQAPDDALPYGYLDDAWLVARVWAEVQTATSSAGPIPSAESSPTQPPRRP